MPSRATSHEVRITSSPRGASVYRGDIRIGTTPLTLSLKSTDAPQALIVDAPGYRARPIVVGTERDSVNVVLLSGRPQKPAAEARGVAEW